MAPSKTILAPASGKQLLYYKRRASGDGCGDGCLLGGIYQHRGHLPRQGGHLSQGHVRNPGCTARRGAVEVELRKDGEVGDGDGGGGKELEWIFVGVWDVGVWDVGVRDVEVGVWDVEVGDGDWNGSGEARASRVVPELGLLDLGVRGKERREKKKEKKEKKKEGERVCGWVWNDVDDDSPRGSSLQSQRPCPWLPEPHYHPSFSPFSTAC